MAGVGPGRGSGGAEAAAASGGAAGLRLPDAAQGGNARTGPLPLHPMTLSDILDGAFNLFKAEARAILLVTAAFIIPVQLVAAFLQRDYLGGSGLVSLFSDPTAAESALDSGSTGQGWGTLVALVATVFVLPFVAGAVSRIVSAAYLGERMTAGEALRAVRARWWAFIVAWVLVHLLEVVGFVMCIFPGLVVMAFFVAVAPAIAVEGLGPIRGMKRSFRLVRPRLFPVLGDRPAGRPPGQHGRIGARGRAPGDGPGRGPEVGLDPPGPGQRPQRAGVDAAGVDRRHPHLLRRAHPPGGPRPPDHGRRPRPR